LASLLLERKGREVKRKTQPLKELAAKELAPSAKGRLPLFTDCRGGYSVLKTLLVAFLTPLQRPRTPFIGVLDPFW
jgi:hypothetical protein